ncbi:putative transcription factor interactor and regulator CCHC(Zn) family [Helianthus annuus]|nr:putative transcription factor interactor and regulator CCHC(Zn) family [Helianthus annuus]
MCFICGGPHYTKYCPNDSRCPIDFDANPLVQPQSYPSQGYSTYYSSNSYSEPQSYQNSYPSPYQNFYTLPYQSCNENECPPYFQTLVESCQVIAQSTAALEQMLRESNNQPMDPFCRRCAGPHKYEDCPVTFQGAMPSDSKETPLEDTESTNENDKVDREEREEKNGKFIIDFTCSNEEIDAQLAAYKRWKGEDSEEDEEESIEEIIPVTETKMDVEVPPPVQQVVNSSYLCPTPRDIDDGFWSDDDEGVVEEAELEVPDYTTARSEEVEEEPLDKMEDEKETLLVETPTMEIKYTPNVEEKAEEKFDSRPVEKLEVGSPPQLKTRENARRNLDRQSMGIQMWCKRKFKATLKCRDNHLPRYMHRIRFLPGKFKFWWSDPFKIFKIFCNSTDEVLIICEDRVELNGLDKVQIKEKPPD